MNVYGPNDDSPDFFQNINGALEEIGNETIVICGDFNLVQNQDLDTYNYVILNNPRAKNKVLNLKEELNMVDPFREIYDDLRRFTRRKANPIKNKHD